MKAKKQVTFILAMTLVVALAGCGGGSESNNTATPAKADSSVRCLHEIKQEKCPFCTPSLIQSDGFCGEHGVAEALCYLCRPYLKAAFRAKGDWCAEHNAPDSQCMICHPDLKNKVRPGEHGATNTGGAQG